MRIEGRENGCLKFFLRFGAKMLDIYLEKNRHKIKFCEKNTLVASYSREVIALEICRKVTFGQSFGNKH